MDEECKKILEDTIRQRDYYKEMYEMRTEAYIRDVRTLEASVLVLNGARPSSFTNEELEEIMYSLGMK